MAEIHGLGSSRKRVEDARFIRGQGNYIDDFKLPGMLHLDIVRSPYAHAKIKAIRTEKALATPGVLAFIDGPRCAGGSRCRTLATPAPRRRRPPWRTTNDSQYAR